MFFQKIRIGINRNKIRLLPAFFPLSEDRRQFFRNIIHAESGAAELHAGRICPENIRHRIKRLKITLDLNFLLDHRILLQFKMPAFHFADPIPPHKMFDQFFQKSPVLSDQRDLTPDIQRQHLALHTTDNIFSSFKPEFHMRFYADLHQKIEDLIDDLEIIPGIPLLDLDHHIIGK